MTMTSCVIAENRSSTSGGGIRCVDSVPVIASCTAVFAEALNEGGATTGYRLQRSVPDLSWSFHRTTPDQLISGGRTERQYRDD
jgi:predicted outer membrane repeat protein